MTCTLELLQKIAENTAQDKTVWVAALSGGAAVLGAFAGALVSYIVARQTADSQLQIETARLRANVVTTERLRWLQDIRQRLAQLSRQMDMQYNLLKRPVIQGQSTQQTQLMFDTLSAEIMEQSNIITLMLNPTKPYQSALRDALQEAMSFLAMCFDQKNRGIVSFDDSHYQSIKQAAFDALTNIGIKTWARIQKLE